MTALATDHRKKMLAKIHIAKKDLALDDGTYRAILKRITGQESATNLDHADLDRVIAECKRLGWDDAKRQRKRAGARPLHQAPMASKIRALWLDLFHLGELVDPSEDALAAFVARTTGIDALNWVDGERANEVIDALHGWLQRVGYRRPTTDRLRGVNVHRRACDLPPVDLGFMFKVALIEAQWERLIGLGVFQTGDFARLETWIARNHGVAGAALLAPSQADAAIERLSAWLRREQAKRGATVEQ